MINVSRLYCGIASESDNFRYLKNSGLVAVYNCTRKCSQNCLHCYSKNGSTDKELDTKQAKELLNQLAENKCSVVLFSGGEPLERTDLFELLAYSHSLGLRTVLSTNGNLINAAIAEKLVNAGVKYAGISVDGTEKTHDSFRGIAGSFQSAVRAINFCKEVNLKVGLRFTITNRNFSQVRDIFSLAEKLRIQRICFYHLIPVGEAVKNNLKCTDEQIRSALNEILSCSKEFSSKGVTEVLTVGNQADGAFILNRLKQENSPLYEKSLSLLEQFGGNKADAKIFDIDASGNVHPDQFHQDFTMGNITQQKLRDIFEGYIKNQNLKCKIADSA